MIGGGKDGRIFVLNKDNMGGYDVRDHVIQEVQTGVQQFDNIFSTPSYWNGSIYYHCEGDVLKAYGWKNGFLSNTPTSAGNFVFGVHGATTSVSSNGNASGIIWEIESSNQPKGLPAILRAYDALNVANELYDSNQAPNGRDQAGPAVKFVVPTVTDGQVFVGTGNQTRNIRSVALTTSRASPVDDLLRMQLVNIRRSGVTIQASPTVVQRP